MYGWVNNTANWKKPGGYDFGDAEKPYLGDPKAKTESERSYVATKAPNLELVDPKKVKLASDSKNPIVVAVDGTGSMQTWPAEIFDRLPLLYATLAKYQSDVELSFSVIGDVNSDDWPVQVGAFDKGPALDDVLQALHPEGGGGPGIRESYELWAYFMQECCTTEKATNPFMIIMGDEMFYDSVNAKQAKSKLGLSLQADVPAMEVWKNLGQRYDIRLLRKQYGSGQDEKIEAQWAEAIGQQNIVPVYEKERVVDVAIGLVAKRWGEYSDFEINLSARQDSKGIAIVKDSLKAVPENEIGDMKSVVKSEGKKSVPLTEVET